MSDAPEVIVEVEAPATPAPSDMPEVDHAKEAEKWKALARKHETEKKSLAEKAKQFDALQEASASEQEKAVKAAVAEAEKRTASKYNDRIIRSEIKAAAGGKLNDPADAVRLLDLSAFEVNEDGDVDTEAISKAIDDLLTSKPYLGTKTDARPKGDIGGGPRPSVPVKVDTMEAALADIMRQGKK